MVPDECKAGQLSSGLLSVPDVWRGPVPADEPETRGFWDALRDHRVAIQRCDRCRRWQHPPVVACPGCACEDLSFETVSGDATIYAFSVVHREFGLQIGTPWVVAQVQLDDAPVRLATNIVECTPDDPSIGASVVPVFKDYDDIGLTLAFFRLRTDESGAG